MEGVGEFVIKQRLMSSSSSPQGADLLLGVNYSREPLKPMSHSELQDETSEKHF